MNVCLLFLEAEVQIDSTNENGRDIESVELAMVDGFIGGESIEPNQDDLGARVALAANQCSTFGDGENF